MRAKRIDEIRRSDDANGLGTIGAGRTQHAAAWRELDVVRQQYTGRVFFARPRAGTMGECRTHVADMLGCPVNRVVMLNPFLGEGLTKGLEEKCERMISDEAAAGETVTRDLRLDPYGNHVIVKVHLTGALRVALVKLEVTGERDVTSTYYMMGEPAEVNEVRRGGNPLGSMGVGEANLHRAWDALRAEWTKPNDGDNPVNWETLESLSKENPKKWPEWLVNEIATRLNSVPTKVRMASTVLTFTRTDRVLSQLQGEVTIDTITDPLSGEPLVEIMLRKDDGIARVEFLSSPGGIGHMYYAITQPRQNND
jgi:hypothetical protein